jgi:hypothetical protein
MAAFALRAPSTTLPSARRYSTSISTGVVVVVDDEHGEAVQRLATAGQEPKVAASARVRLLARESVFLTTPNASPGGRGGSESERGKPTTAASASSTTAAFENRCAALGARAILGGDHSGAWAAIALGKVGACPF